MSNEQVIFNQEETISSKKTKLGVIMFVIYALIYFGFIVLNVTNTKLMKVDVGSLNVAIVYGFGLITLAVVQALIYNAICDRIEKKYNLESTDLKTKQIFK